MSELTVGTLSGLAANSYVIDVASGSLLTQAGMILQVVRATDTTLRTTTSTSLTDVTGMSVTITPQKADSEILIISTGISGGANASVNDSFRYLQIADSSDNAISGAESMEIGLFNITGSGTKSDYQSFTLIGRDAPATTSATTYKLRFRSAVATTTHSIRNATTTGQMYAIEIAG